MHSRTALALVCALGLVPVGALESRLGAPRGPGAALAQVVPTATRFEPRPAPTLALPTLVPTPGLPAFPLVPSPTRLASPTASSTVPARPLATATASPPAPQAPTTQPTPLPPVVPEATAIARPTPAADATAAPPPPAEPPPAAEPADQSPAPDAAEEAPAPAGPQATPPPQPSAAPTAPSTVVVPPLVEMQPPSIQLRFGTAIYDGVRGSYCWAPPPAPGAAPVPGSCADVLPPIFDTVLAWPAGEPLAFLIDGPEPTALTLTVYSRPTDPLVLEAELPPGTSVTWQPTVPPGAYVLGVAARWPQGDVTYYFPVGITADDTPNGPAPAEPSLAPGDGIIGPAAPESPPPAPSVALTPIPTVAASPTPASTAASALPQGPGGRTGPPSATPTAVASAASRAAPTQPSPSVLPAPGAGAARVLLRDDFTDPSSGFPLESRDPTARQLGYLNGEYRVARLAGSGGEAFVAYPETFADFQAEIDARLEPPTENAYVFLDFRRQENGDYYSFLVDPNAGRFLLLRHTSDDRRLIDWTAAAAIRPGAATNRLGVRARGSTIVLLLDGTEVGRAQDDSLREGWVGFGVGSLADARAEGRFGHLLVTAIE
jgi:hypothetical protein